MSWPATIARRNPFQPAVGTALLSMHNYKVEERVAWSMLTRRLSNNDSHL